MAAGLSQADLAKAADITYQQIQKYEQGGNRISTGRLYNFARIFDVPLDYFVDGFESSQKRYKKKTNKQLMDNILFDKNTADLARYYHRIDKKMRKHVYELLKGMAEKS